MEAIGLNPIRLDRIGLDPIRVNAIKLGVPGAASGSARPYIDPEVLASLVAVCICDGKSNNDPDRAVIKNLVDPDNPFVISNAAYEGMSGHNGYPVVFGENKTYQRVGYGKATSTVIHLTNIYTTQALMFSYIKDAGKLTSLNKDYPSYKIKVSGIKKEFRLRYQYVKNADNTNISVFDIFNDGTYAIPKSVASDGSLTSDNVWVGFIFIGTVPESVDITIEVLPEYEGAFVTDGKDDLITSTKTVKEMLGGSNEVTVVSMVHQIGLSSLTTINNIRSESVAHVVCRNICSSAGKTGVYGYSRQINTNNPPTLINNILGDKKDYTAEGNSALDPTDKFFVQGYKYSGSISEVSPIAYYWTFVSNKVLTTDQINQVISYFNLDKHVKPDIIYDTIRQGITNENHASFNDELTDFSGNGHNMKIYNSAWKLGSGIGKYEEDFTSWLIGTNINVTNDTIKAVGIVSGYVSTKVTPNSEIAPFTIKVTGIPKNGEIRYYYCSSSTKIDSFYIREDGQYNVPQSERWELTGAYRVGFTISNPSLDWSRLVIEQIPDHEGALVSDGIDDYGKVENLPIYKDYTVVADREIVDGLIDNANGGVATRSYNYAKGAFGFDWKNQAFSFGGNTDRIIDVQRFISYQSKYINNGIQLITGNVVDNNPLYMARLGEENRYSKLALWSFLLFPYTLSEFLLERQLKRYKLGTLYPDMVEFRPIIKNNNQYRRIDFYTQSWDKKIYPGDYVPINSILRANIYLNNELNELQSFRINGVNVTFVKSSVDKTAYNIGNIPIAKSPQKIDITIDEYIRFEDIIQPYPAIVNLSQDGKSITWGDKLKVGSDIVFVESANLLPELYTVSETRYNGVTLYPNTIIKVEKSMVFDNARTYLKANEPSCILSPNRLRIPNSSYKILGYIPDLTGKGNHGIINNSAYAEMSGANGYKYDWNTYTSHIAGVKPTDNAFKVNLTAETSTTALFGTPIFTVGSKSHYFRFKISGLINNQKIQIDYPKGSDDTVITSDRFGNGEYSTKDYTVGEVKRLNFYVINAVKGEPISVSIEQLPEYESSFCLDGVDDFVTIPTLAHGGKQVLMKVNYKLNNGTTCTIYDQRSSTRWLPTFCIYSNNEAIAYSDGNSGKTYIDGVLNTSVKGRQLANITHNITIANEDVTDVNSVSPKIGTLFVNGSAYAQMALFDFMLFPEISSEDEIKELNECVGIEGNVWGTLTQLINLTLISNETLIKNE